MLRYALSGFILRTLRKFLVVLKILILKVPSTMFHVMKPVIFLDWTGLDLRIDPVQSYGNQIWILELHGAPVYPLNPI
jgi:hypothetical protein